MKNELRFPRLVTLASVALLQLPAAAAPVVSTSTLLDDMTNLAGMAEFPDPSYTCRQSSSYDRASKSPTQDWFANNDAGQYLRVEDRDGRKEYVMMDADGPGAIVRVWSANPAGTLRIYLDGEDRPVLQAPMADLLGGRFPGLPRPIAGEYSKGWNLYFPIAYARHCKVTSDQGKFYYHVNYRTYAAGTQVQSFRSDDLQTLATRIGAVNTRLSSPRGEDRDTGGQAQEFDLQLEPGQSITEEFQGSLAITRAVMRIASQDRDAALRGIVVRITFDGERCIEAPIGDVFGSAPGLNTFSSLPLGVTAEGEMYSHWFMPFRNYASIELANSSKVSATLTGEIALKDYEWTERSMHFHAKWRAQFDVPTRPMQDWNYLKAQGRGVFAGVAFAIDNPVKDWWGEGDEKIYVDGESFPSHFGTGTEDYYGYAWCWPATFTHAYHSQPRCDGPGNYGRTSVNRFDILDRIPFTKDFRFDMELWHWNAKCQVNMAVVAFWYARPGATDQFKPIRAEEVIVRPMAAYVVPHVPGALEGENLAIAKVTGVAEPQDWDGLSGGKHLWWHEGMKPGDVLNLAFPAPTAGQYHVFARFLQARDYGMHRLSINGKLAREIDFFNAQVKPTEEIDLGIFALEKDRNELAVEVAGANAQAIRAYMFGLDYLRLKPAE